MTIPMQTCPITLTLKGHDGSTVAEAEVTQTMLFAAPKLLAALKWYVENDKAGFGDDASFFAIGRRRAEQAIAEAEGNHVP